MKLHFLLALVILAVSFASVADLVHLNVSASMDHSFPAQPGAPPGALLAGRGDFGAGEYSPSRPLAGTAPTR